MLKFRDFLLYLCTFYLKDSIFLLGGYGRFDMISAMTVKELKKKYPHITSTLVIPYLTREYDLSLYDDSVYPPLENVPKR